MTAPASFPAADAGLMSFAFKQQSTCDQLKLLLCARGMDPKWNYYCSRPVAPNLPNMLGRRIPNRQATQTLDSDMGAEFGKTIEANDSYDVTKQT
jgi:hypothetical protein